MPIKTSGQIGFNDLVDEFGSDPRTAESSSILSITGSWTATAVPISDYYRGIRVPNVVGNEGVPVLRVDSKGLPTSSLDLNTFYGTSKEEVITFTMPDLAVGGNLDAYSNGGGTSSWRTRLLDRKGANVDLDVTSLSYKISVSDFRIGLRGSFRDAGKNGTDGYSGLRNPGLRIYRRSRAFFGGLSLLKESRGSGQTTDNTSTSVNVPGMTVDVIGGVSGYNVDELLFVYVVDFYNNGGEGTPQYFWDNLTLPTVTIQTTRLDNSYQSVASGDSTGVVTASVISSGGSKK